MPNKILCMRTIVGSLEFILSHYSLRVMTASRLRIHRDFQFKFYSIIKKMVDTSGLLDPSDQSNTTGLITAEFTVVHRTTTSL